MTTIPRGQVTVFETNPRRDAWGTIAGFIFQVNTTILRWLELADGELLELERGEDIDIVQTELADGVINVARVLEQTKRRTSTGLTLNSPEALEAIANFAEHQSVNPGLRLRFRYVTTAPVKIERNWPDDNGGIATWEALRRGELSIDEQHAALIKIRAFLMNCECPERARGAWKYLESVLKSGDDDALMKLIQAFEWSTSADDYVEAETQIKAAFLKAGYRDSEAGSQQLFESLFLHVFRRLAQPGVKQLTREELSQEVTQTTISEVDHALFQLVSSQMERLSSRISKVEAEVEELALMKDSIATLVENAGVAISLASPDAGVIFDSPELISPAIGRDAAVRTILDGMSGKTQTMIVGEPGSGKTQLCLLTARQVNMPVVWISIPRGSTEVQATLTIDRAVELLTAAKRNNLTVKEWYSRAAGAVRGKLIVIDDLPRMMPGGTLSRRVEMLTNCLQEARVKLLATSFYRAPSMVASFAEVDAPRLTEAEISELLELYGGPADLARGLARMLAASTQGVIVLVVAAARYCLAQGWKVKSDQLEGLLRGDFSKSIKHDSKTLVELTVTDVEARDLLYRLSLTIGGFSRRTVERLAGVSPAIAIPGEKLNHLVGLWIQPFVADKFIQSPLLGGDLGLFLNAKTKAGVHAVLAFETLQGGVLDPLQVIACIYHFNAAGLFNQGALVLIQALLELTEKSELFEQDWGLSSLWVTASLPPEVDINLRVYARALQSVALDMMGRNIQPALDDLGRLVAEAGAESWGVVIASSLLAIRLYRRFPQIANEYLLRALRGFGAVKLPNGDPIPRAQGPALEGLFWATANAVSSDADVESWINTVKQLSKEEVQRLAESDLAADNAVILTDGIWLREYRKGTKEWSKVESLVSKILKLGETIELPILRAAAIRTLIMLQAEFRNDIDGAVKFAEQELAKTNDDETVFLIVEVTGRQLAYAKRSAAAIEWLKRARSIEVKGHSLWRRNVLITLAEEVGTNERKLAVGYLKEALDLSRTAAFETHHRIIEALGEYALGLWNAGDPEAAFAACEEAVRLLFESDEADPYWKKLFLAVFELVWYLSSMAYFERAPNVPNYHPPRQGAFLGLDNVDIQKFVPAQRAFLKIKMAMFAEAVAKTFNAGKWAVEALAIADEIPGARTIYTLAWLDIVPEILQKEYMRAAQMTLVMSDSRSPTSAELEEGGFKEPSEKQRIQNFLDDPRKATVGMIFLGMASVCWLATLQLKGASAEISIAIASIAKSRQGDVRIEDISKALRAVLLEDHDWHELRTRGSAVINTDAAVSFVYYIGSTLKGPLAQALSMQVWLAENMAKLSGPFPSLQRAILWPFFGAFWSRAISEEPEQFRTGESYTRSQLEQFAENVSLDGVKRLLASMAFCLGVSLPDTAKGWLSTR